jgi:Heterodisulfide reductase, subunit B
MTRTFSYYPGCTLKNKAKDLDIHARQSASALGIDLDELKDWQCCGAVYPMAADEIATRLSSVRALMSAKENTLITLCSACHHVIKRVNLDMRTKPNIADKVNRYMKNETAYTGETSVVHYLEMLRDEIGFDELKKAVKNPLKGRKIAAYYGCLLLRPGKEMSFDNPENPTIIEDFITALGAKPVIYPYRNECCGAYVALEKKTAAQNKCEAISKSASEFGADTIVTACPLCLYKLKVNTPEKARIPVVYFTELLYEALGLSETEEA